MADSLCGPSNPLQNIQKHVLVDKTLQQDRLAARQSPSQGFRSLPGPNAGILDAEFEAFQAGQAPGAGLYPHQHFHYNGPVAPGAFPPPASLQSAPGWASDFQRLSLNEARSSPIPQSQFRHEAPLQRNSAGWHQEFTRQQNQRQGRQPYLQPHNQGSAWNQRRPFENPFEPFTGFSGPTAEFPSVAQQKQPEQQVEGAFDAEKFEREFTLANLEIRRLQEPHRVPELEKKIEELTSELAVEARERRERQAERDGYIRQVELDGEAETNGINRRSGEELMQLDPLTEQERIGSDTIVDEAQENAQHHSDQSDVLARTAGQLLENLKHEQDPKFQQSNFLSLMRQLRDKEVRVEGNQMVEVSSPSSSRQMKHNHIVPAEAITCQTSQSLHPGGQYYPGGSDATMSGAIGSDENDTDPSKAFKLSVARDSSDGSSVTEKHSARISTDLCDAEPEETGPPQFPGSASSSPPSPRPPPFSSLYFPPALPSEEATALVTEPDPSALPALAPAPPFQGPRTAAQTAEADIKAALPQDTKAESSSKSLDDGEPPPPYTEGSSPLEGFTYVMAAAGGAASIITQVQQGGPAPVNTVGDVNGDEHITLDLRGTRFTLSRDELLTLPEFVLLSLFPNGLLPDGHVNSFHEGDVYPVDYDPTSLQYMLEFFRNVAQTIPSGSPSPSDPTNPSESHQPSSIDPMSVPGSARDMLQDRAGIIVLREDLDFYAIPPKADIEPTEMIDVKRAAGRALLGQDGIFSGLRRSEEAGTTEQHLIEMLTAGGFNSDDHWGHRAGEPNKAVICSLALARLRTDIKGNDLANSNAVGMAQKLLLFWRKPARRCWWEGIELEDVEGVEGRLKVWIRRVWTLEMRNLLQNLTALPHYTSLPSRRSLASIPFARIATHYGTFQATCLAKPDKEPSLRL
ncbi:hypothetical protein MMC20_004415 [Loxospora ochrophaea]|nr:hypothetical protein [Loxospora ochrophaea]